MSWGAEALVNLVMAFRSTLCRNSCRMETADFQPSSVCFSCRAQVHFCRCLLNSGSMIM